MKRNKRDNMGMVQSVQDRASTFQEVLQPEDTIEPPDHVSLTESELIFFYEIIDEFNRKDWTGHQLTLAALLARELYSLERQQRILRKEGAVIEGSRGYPMVNPRRNVISAHTAAILRIRQSLALNARSMAKTVDRARNLKRLSDMRSDAELVYGDEENEDLLPRMN